MDDRQCTESIGIPLARKLTKEEYIPPLNHMEPDHSYLQQTHDRITSEPPPPQAAKAIENEDNLSIEELKDRYLLLNIKRKCGLCGTATGVLCSNCIIILQLLAPKARKSLIASVSQAHAAIISKFYAGKTGSISVPAKDGPFRAIRRARRRKMWTQSQLASFLGVKLSYVKAVETGRISTPRNWISWAAGVKKLEGSTYGA